MSPFPENFRKFVLEIVQSGVKLKQKYVFLILHGGSMNMPKLGADQIGSVVNSPVKSGEKLQLPTIVVHFERMHYFGLA